MDFSKLLKESGYSAKDFEFIEKHVRSTGCQECLLELVKINVSLEKLKRHAVR
jgi:hypothetical protein